MRSVLGFLAFAGLFLACDAVWLTTMGPRVYTPLLGPLLAPRPRAAPAILFYLVYLTIAFRFCVLGVRSVAEAARRGALFGLAAYATYDLTNEATLRVWPLQITLLDLAWGAGLTALAASLAARLSSSRRPAGITA